MRLRIYSDLHLEFAPFEPPDCTGVDVVILAGDIDVKGRGAAFARRFPCPVVYVPGNHEYYGGAIPHLRDKLRAACEGSNVHVLDDGVVELAGVRFIGATFWTDWVGEGLFAPDVAMETARHRVTDFSRIRVSPAFSRLRPADRLKWHQRSKSFIARTAQEPFAGPTVVVTHFVPTLKGLNPAEVGGPLSGNDATNAEQLFGPHVSTWVFGHSHVRFDQTINGTRVVSNPRGYPDEPVTGFDPSFTIDVR